MDTRTKILNAEEAAALNPARPLLLATGRFDILRADMARELKAARARTGAGSVAIAILPLADELAPPAARAEMAAALRVVDYVFLAPEGDLASLVQALQPLEILRLEEADEERKRRLTEHVHSTCSP